VQLGAFTYDICNKPGCPVLYRADIRDNDACPLCKTLRYQAGKLGMPCKKVVYMSITSYIQYLFSSADMVRALCWWSSERHKHTDAAYSSDVYDSDLWRRFMSDPQMQAGDQHSKRLPSATGVTGVNLAFCGCTDGASPFKRKNHSINPIALSCFNLPPWVRNTLAAMHICCIIPGGKHMGHARACAGHGVIDNDDNDDPLLQDSQLRVSLADHMMWHLCLQDPPAQRTCSPTWNSWPMSCSTSTGMAWR
jgi:hypothetical protein